MVGHVEYCPERGDVIWLTFNPQPGHEQKGRKPAIVLSPYEYNRKTGLLLACPVTSQIKGYPFEVLFPEKCPVSGVVLADQVRNLDWKARRAELIFKAPQDIVKEILAKTTTLFT